MISTNNFFKRNTSLRNPAAPYKKGKFVDQSPEYKSRVFSRVQESPLTKTLLSMRKNVLGIENALRGLFELDKKKQATDQKFDLAEKQEAKDKPKVKPKTPKIFGNIIERPKTGVLDAIKNFVTFTFLGWLFTRLQPFIGKVGGLVPLLENIMKFFSGLIVGTLNAFASFLKFGYDAKDTFDLKIKEIKKETEGISKHFDNTLGELKTVFSGAIEVVNSFLNTSVDEEELKTARQDAPKDSPETNIPPLPKLPDVATVSPSSSAASNINGDSPIGKTGPQSVPMPTTSPTIYKVNTGGRIDPTKTPITRGTEQKEKRVIRRKPDIQQQKTVPGKDVGGEDKVKEVYGEEAGTFKPDFIPNSIFFRTETKSGYAGLLKAAEEYKRPNDRDILGLGNLMGATVDTALGQKLERRTITQFADGIRYLVDQGMSNPEEFKKIDLELMIRRIVEPKIEAAINKIRDEVNKKSKERPTDEIGDGEYGYAGGEYGAYAPTGIEKHIYDYLINEKKMNDIQALGLMANISRESSFIPNNREPGGTGVGLFQWSHGRVRPFIAAVPDWETNWKKQIDYALSEPEQLSSVKPGEYQSKQFKSAQEAADWWMNEWERPRDKISGSRKHATYLKNVPRAADGSARFRAGESVSPGGFKIPKADYIKGVFDQSKEPGFDVTWKGNNNIAILPGRVKEIGQLYGRNYGNVVVIESVDPVNGKKVDVLYSHFPNGGIVVREGQMVGSGQVLGRMGKPGEPGIGNITGQHASIDFYEPNKSRGKITGRYSRWQGLAREAINAASTGRVPASWAKSVSTQEAQTQQPKRRNTRGGGSIIVEPRSQSAPPAPSLPRGLSSEGYLINGKMYYLDIDTDRVLDDRGNKVEVGPGKKEWLLKEIYIMRERRKEEELRGKRSSLNIKPPSPILPEEKYPSYNDPTRQTTVAIQLINIKELVPVSTGSGSVIAFATPSVSPNYKSQSLSRS